MAERVMLDACFVQARANDGRKESMCCASDNNAKDVAKWIDLQVANYLAFKARVACYPHHRPRLAYVVKVYAK